MRSLTDEASRAETRERLRTTARKKMEIKARAARGRIRQAKEIYIWVNCAWDENGNSQDGQYLKINKKQALEITRNEDLVPMVQNNGIIHIN